MVWELKLTNLIVFFSVFIISVILEVLNDLKKSDGRMSKKIKNKNKTKQKICVRTIMFKIEDIYVHKDCNLFKIEDIYVHTSVIFLKIMKCGFSYITQNSCFCRVHKIVESRAQFIKNCTSLTFGHLV